MASQAVVELPLTPVAAEVFQSAGTADRDEAEAAAVSWLEDMVHGSWRFDWLRRGSGAVVAEPHADLPCVVLSGAREHSGWWVPTLFLMAGRRETTGYWQWATCGERQAPKVAVEAIEAVEWVVDMLLCVAESSIKTHPE
jgi:hypothetical protein